MQQIYSYNHNTCLSSYLKTFQTRMEAILSYDDEVNDQEDVDNVLDGIIETFEVDKHGYVISEVRGMMNQSLADKGIG